MDDHISVLVSNFDNHTHYEQSHHDITKNNYTTKISTTSNIQMTNYQPITQNLVKEVVTVSPMYKLDSDVVIHKNIKSEDRLTKINDMKPMMTPQKRSRGHIDRYNGMTEEEVMQRKLPDYLREGLDLIVVGINPSMTSACVGHHYAGIGNHFWTCITEAGLVPEQVTCYDDYRMVDYGIGFTNVCSRPTKGAAEISRKEMKAGALIMLEKMRKYRPKIAVFNGKGIYEAFVGHKNFYMGKQPKTLDGTDIIIFVMPSSSARCAQLPRAEDKLPFFVALRKLRDCTKGRLSHLNDQDVIFTDYTEFRVTQPDPKSLRKAERRRKRKAEQMLAVTGCDQLFGCNKPRKNRALINSIQSQKSGSVASTKENDYGLSTHELTPATLPEDSTSQIEIPIAVLNQSNGLISLLPSDFLINGSLAGFNIANQNSILTLNNKNNSSMGTGKQIILQQDASGQTYMLAASSPMLQNASISVPQLTALAASNQQTTATLMPWGGNATFALIQPNQIVNSNQNNNNDNNNSPTISWNNSNITLQGSPQMLSQPSNMIYQKNSNPGCTQQIICSAATLQQLLQQQQQSQQQQIQIVNPLSFSQPITIQAPLDMFSGLGNNFGNIQFQQIANCLSESMSGEQMSNSGNDQLLQQDSLCQVTCSMTPSSSDNSVSFTNGNIQSINGQNLQTNSSNGTSHDTQSQGQQATVLGYSLAPNSQSNQNLSLGANHNMTLAYISNQPSLQNLSPTFSTLNNGNTTHIVIPISGTNLIQAGNILQLADGQQQRILCGQSSATNIMNCFATCGSLSNSTISSSNNSTNINDISISNSCNLKSQMLCSRAIVSSSNTSAISSIAGQTDLDLISSSSGINDASSASQLYHQHCSAPVQLADCEDQLVQCSSSDEKLVYSAL